MPLRVAVVTESFLPSVNGVTNSVVRVLESLKEDGHEAMVVAPTSTDAEFLGFPVTRINRVFFKQFAVALPHLRLAKIITAFEPDVIHVAAPFAFGRQAIKVAKRLGIPSIAIYQTDISGYAARYGLAMLRPALDRLIGAIHRRATINLAPTQEGADYLRRIGAKNVSIWGRGVNLEQFNPDHRSALAVSEYRNKLNGRQKCQAQTVIGFVGRLATEKQVDRFVELFGLPNVSFLIVGDGPERARLEKLFDGQNAIFTGKLSGEALSHAYATMDIFVHCGTEETFGQTIQEAQASGLAVIAPNVGGPAFLIDSGKTGLLVNPNENKAYRYAVAQLLDDPAKIKWLGESARESVIGKSWTANNQQLVKHYRNAIDLNTLMRGLLVR